MTRSGGKRGSSRHKPWGVDILYEDRDIIVVNKRAGTLTIGTDRGGEDERTAYSSLTDYVRKGDPRSRNRVFIVHRLDRETTGVLVFARTEEAKRDIQDHWDETEKIYLAIVEGRPDENEGMIESYLTETTALKVYSTRDPRKGKLARTEFRVLRRAPRVSLLQVRILTGRKHQIRAHFAEQGWPIQGDKKYGRQDGTAKHLGLHALRLTFHHPHTRERLTFEAPPPSWFNDLVGTGDGYATE